MLPPAQAQQQTPQSSPMTPEMQDLLTQLKDIQEPSTIGWWPLAPGWWLAGIILLSLITLAVLALLQLRQRRERERYRQEGVRLLQEVDTSHPRAVEAINTLLKRVAVVSFGRRRCAALTGTAWVEFLQTSSGLEMSEPARNALLESLYRTDCGRDGITDLQSFAVQWVRRHNPQTYMDSTRKHETGQPQETAEVSGV